MMKYSQADVINILKADSSVNLTHQLVPWVTRPDSIIDDPKTFINTILPMWQDDEKGKAQLITALILKPGIVLPLSIMIHDTFPRFTQNNQLLLLSLWMSIPANAETANAIIAPEPSQDEDIQTMRTRFASEAEQAALIAGWSINPANTISEDLLLKIYPLIHNKLGLFESIILASFASKPGASPGEHAKKLVTLFSLDNHKGLKNHDIAEEWAKNVDNTHEFQEALKLLGNENDKFVLASAWFAINKHQDPLVLLNVLPQLSNPDHQSELATNLISRLLNFYHSLFQISIESLLNTMPYINEGDRSRMTIWWLQNNTMNADELNQLLDLIKDSKDKLKVINTWTDITRITLSAEQLVKAVPAISVKTGQLLADEKEFIKNWLEVTRKTGDLTALTTVISAYAALFTDREKSVSINNCIESSKKIDASDILKILPLFKEEETKLEMARNIVSSNLAKISPAVFEQILMIFNADKDKKRLIQEFIDKPQNIWNFETLNLVMPLYEHEHEKMRLVEHWSTQAGEILGAESLIKNIKSMKCGEELKCKIITVWLKNPDNPHSAEDMISLLNAFDDKSDASECKIIDTFFDKTHPKNNMVVNTDIILKIILSITKESQRKTLLKDLCVDIRSSKRKLSGSTEALVKIIQMFSLESDADYQASTWIDAWLNHVDKTFKTADIVSLLSEVKDDLTKSSIIDKFIKIPGNTVDAASLSSILSTIKTQHYSKEVVYKWLNQDDDQNKRYERLIALIDAKIIGSPYTQNGIKNIVSQFTESIGFKSSSDKVIDLCKHLYPSAEHMQVSFFMELVKFAMDDLNNRYSDACHLIKEFSQSLHESDPCFELLQFGKQYGIKPIDILMISNNRLASKHASLAAVLDKPLMQSIKPLKRTYIEGLFGSALPSDIKLSALFAYADMQRDLEKLFTDVVEQKIIDDIKDNFEPSSKLPYMTSEEHTALTNAFNIDPLPKMELLCDYLQSKLSPIPSIALSISNLKYEVTLPKDEICIDEIDYKKKYIALLDTMDSNATEDVKMKSVTEFFTFITKTEQGEAQQKKLYELFLGLKNELTFLFSEKNGITNYLGILAGIADGCVANISMKTKMYIYESLIDPRNINPQDAVLYSFLCDKIAYPFFETGDKLGGSVAQDSADVLKNRELRALYISVPGLLAGIASEFANLSVGPAKYIQSLSTEDECGDFYVNLYEANKKGDYSQQEGILASYLIIRKAMPGLLNAPYLATFIKNCEDWLTADFNPAPNNVSSRNKI